MDYSKFRRSTNVVDGSAYRQAIHTYGPPSDDETVVTPKMAIPDHTDGELTNKGTEMSNSFYPVSKNEFAFR